MFIDCCLSEAHLLRERAQAFESHLWMWRATGTHFHVSFVRNPGLRISTFKEPGKARRHCRAAGDILTTFSKTPRQ